jgi:hypothetical protein
MIDRSIDQVQVAGARTRADEGSLPTSGANGEVQGAIEADREGHVLGDAADGTDALDRREMLMSSGTPVSTVSLP